MRGQYSVEKRNRMEAEAGVGWVRVCGLVGLAARREGQDYSYVESYM